MFTFIMKIVLGLRRGSCGRAKKYCACFCFVLWGRIICSIRVEVLPYLAFATCFISIYLFFFVFRGSLYLRVVNDVYLLPGVP